LPVAQRLGWGAHAVRPSSFGRGPPKNTFGGPFHTPAQNTYGGAPSLPYPTTPLTLRSPKPNHGQLTLKGPTCGVLFAPLILGPWASDPKSKKIGGCNFVNPPFWAHSGSLALFCTFGLLSIRGPSGPHIHLPIPNLSPANPPILGKT